ncbi:MULTISPECIES: Txe/YoeB family addiction module toxin [unclassified Streptomyces]|uniref:Txe/YoeB family addiction module toxin n=1 Tax=unclassified Streptomyces TaxID=2593676 RepID=UPI002E2C0302|nr:Txe/YoeB family addiction module toxin [Streptomyces sp. NBC_00273]
MREAPFEGRGREGCTSWLKSDRKVIARINEFIEDVRRDPVSGIGKPEPGVWSRRIDDEHRLVHLVTDQQIVVLAARYHY